MRRSNRRASRRLRRRSGLLPTPCKSGRGAISAKKDFRWRTCQILQSLCSLAAPLMAVLSRESPGWGATPLVHAVAARNSRSVAHGSPSSTCVQDRGRGAVCWRRFRMDRSLRADRHFSRRIFRRRRALQHRTRPSPSLARVHSALPAILRLSSEMALHRDPSSMGRSRWSDSHATRYIGYRTRSRSRQRRWLLSRIDQKSADLTPDSCRYHYGRVSYGRTVANRPGEGCSTRNGCRPAGERHFGWLRPCGSITCQ